MPELPEIDGARGILVYYGLGRPVSRAFVAAVVAGGLTHLAKPNFAYTEEGRMRGFTPLSRDPESTNAHFLTVPLAVGAAVYLFT